MMNITLVRPPAYSIGLMGAQLVPFLGIVYIAAAIRKAGHNVYIVDMCAEDIDRTEIVHGKYVAYGMPVTALKKHISSSQIFGVTCMFSQDWIFHRELICYIRAIYPQSTIIAGGEHVSALPEYCLRDCPELDICVVGEGEEAFVKLVEALDKGGELSGVPSLAYRSLERDVVLSTPRTHRIKDLDKITWPAWDLVPLENYLCRNLNYHIRRGRTIPMLASRGCPYRCTFCSNSNMWGSPWIARDPGAIADEMDYYIKNYRADNFVFSDLSAVVKREGIVNLCNEIINRRLNITWQLPTLRTEAVDYDILKLMYQAGCRDLDFAIESGSKEVLSSVNKRNNPHKISLLIKHASRLGMNLSTNIVLGLPREGFREFLKTYLLVIKLAFMGLREINVFPFIPYPGSVLFKEFCDMGKIRLGDGYFRGLFAYANLWQAVSWSERFSPKTLTFMRLFLLVNFYLLSLVLHPVRALYLVVNSLNGRTTTKLEGVLRRISINIRAYLFKVNLKIE